MGTSLYLSLPDGQRTDEGIINSYYDYLAEKEKEYLSEVDQEIAPGDIMANSKRASRLQRLEQNEYRDVPISHKIMNTVTRNAEIEVDDLFLSAPERTIYGDDIRVFIERLRDSKEQMKQRDDGFNWELGFELRYIALCEFALENGYGIELN